MLLVLWSVCCCCSGSWLLLSFVARCWELVIEVVCWLVSVAGLLLPAFCCCCVWLVDVVLSLWCFISRRVLVGVVAILVFTGCWLLEVRGDS